MAALLCPMGPAAAHPVGVDHAMRGTLAIHADRFSLELVLDVDSRPPGDGPPGPRIETVVRRAVGLYVDDAAITPTVRVRALGEAEFRDGQAGHVDRVVLEGAFPPGARTLAFQAEPSLGAMMLRLVGDTEGPPGPGSLVAAGTKTVLYDRAQVRAPFDPGALAAEGPLSRADRPSDGTAVAPVLLAVFSALILGLVLWRRRR